MLAYRVLSLDLSGGGDQLSMVNGVYMYCCNFSDAGSFFLTVDLVMAAVRLTLSVHHLLLRLLPMEVLTFWTQTLSQLIVYCCFANRRVS